MDDRARRKAFRILMHDGLAPARSLVLILASLTGMRVISRTPCLPQNADKISLCFSLPNTPGALHQVLGRFALNGLNLTKIESRPIPGKAFEYDFYLDFTGNLHESHTLELLCSLSEELPRFTFLGNYLETKEL